MARDLPMCDGVVVDPPQIIAIGHRREGPIERQNLQAVTSQVTQLGSAYGNAITLLGGRLIKFGVNVSF